MPQAIRIRPDRPTLVTWLRLRWPPDARPDDVRPALDRRRPSRRERAGSTSAVRAAIAGRRPSVVIVFASSELDLAALIAEVRSAVVADVPVVGCTTAGEMSTAGPSVGGVVVVALGGADFSVVTAVAENVDAGLREAGAKVAATVSRLEPRPYRVLVAADRRPGRRPAGDRARRLQRGRRAGAARRRLRRRRPADEDAPASSTTIGC